MRMQIAINPRLRPSAGPLAFVLVALMGIGALVALIRYIWGIGAISNLSNTYPWGFWISFDIFMGIAISSGAFLLAAGVYILDLKEYRPLLIPSILTALLGYFMEVLALLVDLGQPQRIWHLMIYQNWTSNMLLVGLCVMFYLAVLAVEFAPTFFDGVKLPKYATLARRFMVPVVIAGVVISVIHQGSLGALLLIQSAKLFPLWWTPALPIMFFLSAVSIGLAMIIVESTLSSRYFGHGMETHLLGKLARLIPMTLGVYLAAKFVQLGISGDVQYLFGSSWMSVLFWLEMVIGVFIPSLAFSFNRVRESQRAMFTYAVVLLLGMTINRFNVSWLGIHRLWEATYFPSLMELSISAAIFSFGILAFGIAAKYLPLFEEHH